MSTHPSVHCSPATRLRVETELLAAYRVVYKLTGSVSLTKLKISADPKHWSLGFIRRQYITSRRRSSHLELAACVSQEWIHDTPRMAEFARIHKWLVAGTQPLPTPADIDAITLVHAWVINGHRIVLKPVKTMIFTAGSITQISKPVAATRFSLTRELNICTAVFQATVARKIANLLLHRQHPTPIANL